MPPGGRKRKAEVSQVEAEAEARKQEILARVQSLDAQETLEYLEMLCERWKLQVQGRTYEDTMRLAFENFEVPMNQRLVTRQDGNDVYGYRDIDAIIHSHEMEAMAVYHHLRNHNLIGGGDGGDDDEEQQQQQGAEVLNRIIKVMEGVYYAKRIVLSAFQSNVSVHQIHCTDVKLEDDIDAHLGSWSLRFRWIDNELNELQQLLLFLLDSAFEKKLRNQDGYVFEPIIIDGYNTHAFQSIGGMKDWVYSVTKKELQFQQWSNLTHGTNTIKGVEEYLNGCDDYQFPKLVKDRTSFAFRNGVYLATTDLFYEYATATEPLAETIVAAKYFDAVFEPYDDVHDWRNIPTPSFHSILQYQEIPDDACDWMYVFIGRMLYDVNTHDGWQVIPYVKGHAGTGKCFAAGTEILMHDGTIRRVEHVGVGDRVMGDDATPRTVLDLARGVEELWCIAYEGGTMTVTRDHILCLRSSSALVEMTVGQYLEMAPSRRTHLKLYRLGDTETLYAFDIARVPGPQPYFGFQTDGNQRFCLADGIVTHNSTILTHVVKNLYDAIDVGVMSNNIEKKFGIDSLVNKFIFIGPECRNDFAIEQAEFQSIVSGEDIQVNVKHKKAFSTRWTVPGMLAGNEVPTWADAAGSIQRRLTVFDFEKPVVHGDMRLGEKIETELPDLLVKCNRAYREMAATHGSENIWTVLGAYFRKTANELAQTINVLEAFMASDVVEYGSEKCIPFTEFKNAIMGYATINGQSRPTFNNDYFRGPFARREIKQVRTQRTWRGRLVGPAQFLVGVDLVQTEGMNNML